MSIKNKDYHKYLLWLEGTRTENGKMPILQTDLRPWECDQGGKGDRLVQTRDHVCLSTLPNHSWIQQRQLWIIPPRHTPWYHEAHYGHYLIFLVLGAEWMLSATPLHTFNFSLKLMVLAGELDGNPDLTILSSMSESRITSLLKSSSERLPLKKICDISSWQLRNSLNSFALGRRMLLSELPSRSHSIKTSHRAILLSRRNDNRSS